MIMLLLRCGFRRLKLYQGKGTMLAASNVFFYRPLPSDLWSFIHLNDAVRAGPPRSRRCRDALSAAKKIVSRTNVILTFDEGDFGQVIGKAVSLNNHGRTGSEPATPDRHHHPHSAARPLSAHHTRETHRHRSLGAVQ